jgi:hypothetical protein
MKPMFSSRYLSPDAHESAGVPAEAATQVDLPVSEGSVAPAPDMVSRSDFNDLKEQLGRAEGRAKSAQRFSSAAESMGYKDLDKLADQMQQSAAQRKQYQDQMSQYQQSYAQQYYPQGYQQQHQYPTAGGVTPDMIDDRISHRIGQNQATSSHDLGQEAEGQLISQFIASPDLAKIFNGIEVGEYGSAFNAAYSGAGSAAAEIVASAIDNAIYGSTDRYGDEAPDGLRGRSVPIRDPEVFQKVQNRVMAGLKELAAMSVFAVSQKGMTDPPPGSPIPVAISGDELSNSEAKEKRAKEISGFIQQSYNDKSPGVMSDLN